MPAPNSHKVVSGSNDGDCRLYDIETNECVFVYEQFSRKVLSVATSNKLPFSFLSCSGDGTVRLFDIRENYPSAIIQERTFRSNILDRHLQDEQYPGYSSNIFPQAFGGGSADIRSKNTKSLILDFSRTLECQVYSIDYHPFHENIFIASSQNGYVYMYDTRFIKDKLHTSAISSYRNCQLSINNDHDATSCKFSEDGSEILVTCINDCIYLYDTNLKDVNKMDTILSSNQENKNIDQAMRNEKTEELIKSKTEECSLNKNELNFNIDKYTLMNDECEYSSDIDVFIPNNILFLNEYGSNNRNQDSFVDKSKPKLYKQKYKGHINCQTIKSTNFLFKDFVISGSDDGCLYIYNKDGGKLVHILEGEEDIINTAIPHPCLPYIATCGLDSHIKLWSPKIPIESVLESLDKNRKKITEAENNCIRGSMHRI